MCGIAGIIRWDGESVSPETMHRMSDCMLERGPDDSGLYARANVGLGHRRLSIIDLSENGRGPMCNEDESIWLTFNGEIYNFQDLRDELVSRGHTFKSATDTEVVLHGYEEWGTDCVRRLDGMFAFGLWDTRSQSLVLARDRVGEKPLYYSIGEQSIVFASTLHAVLAGLPEKPPLDPDAVDAFLCREYVPWPKTIFRSILKLPPAHLLVCKAGQSEMLRYWDLEGRVEEGVSEEDWLTRLEEQLKAAVKARLVADVPVGAFLSGGVDSSTIVALMSMLTNSGVNTFSVGYDEAGFYTELPYALQVARKYGTVHNEVKFTAQDALQILPELIWQYGEPFGDASSIPVYFVSKRARQNVKVVLTGDAGDELFAGYQRVRAIDLAVHYRRFIPGPIREHVMLRLSNRLSRTFGRHGVISKIETMATYGQYGPEFAYVNQAGWLETRNHIYTQEFYRLLTEHPIDCYKQAFQASPYNDVRNSALYADFSTSLPDDMLVKVDVASMAASLECRAPFLDRNVIELAFSMPFEMKLRNGETKSILKKLAARHVPSEVVYRRKRGFGLPLGIWFRNQWRSLVGDVLLDQRTLQRGYVQPAIIQKVVNEHLSGAADHTTRLWLLLVLELWMRMNLDSTFGRDAWSGPGKA